MADVHIKPPYFYPNTAFTTVSGFSQVWPGGLDIAGYVNKVIEIQNVGTSNTVYYLAQGALDSAGPWYFITSGVIIKTSGTLVSNNSVWKILDLEVCPASNTLQTTGIARVGAAGNY